MLGSVFRHWSVDLYTCTCVDLCESEYLMAYWGSFFESHWGHILETDISACFMILEVQIIRSRSLCGRRLNGSLFSVEVNWLMPKAKHF